MGIVWSEMKASMRRNKKQFLYGVKKQFLSEVWRETKNLPLSRRILSEETAFVQVEKKKTGIVWREIKTEVV